MAVLPLDFFLGVAFESARVFSASKDRQNRRKKKGRKQPNEERRHRHNRDGPDVKSMTRQLTQTHSVSHTTHLMSPLDITRARENKNPEKLGRNIITPT